MNEEIKYGSGTLEDFHFVKKAPAGARWVLYEATIDGLKYSSFFETKLDNGTLCDFTYTENERGRTLKTISRAGEQQKIVKRQDKPDKGATRETISDFATLGVRKEALNYALVFHVDDTDVQVKHVLDTAREFEAYILGIDAQKEKEAQKSAITMMSDLLIQKVRASENPVACLDIDKLFICDPGTREKVYTAAEKTLHVVRRDGFWHDLARGEPEATEQNTESENHV